jgi:nucleotide-binding universal stress UspA family protein
MSSIVVGIDSSECSAHALDWALTESALRDIPLHVVHAWAMPDSPTAKTEAVLGRPGGPSRPNWTPDFHQPQSTAQQWVRRDEIEGHARALVEELVAKAQAARAAPVDGVTVGVAEGGPAAVLVGLADGADQIVVGGRGAGGLAPLSLGSVADQVVRHADCPVTVIRPEVASSGSQVVVGVDGSPESRIAMRRALTEAQARDARLHVVHAYQRVHFFAGGTVGWGNADGAQESAENALAALVADTLGDDYASIDRQAVEGAAAEVLVTAARGADLLVVGSRGHGGFAGLLLGSVSMHCLQHAVCPLQIVT